MPVCAQVHFSRSGFLSLGMIGILVWIILSCEDFSVCEGAAVASRSGEET